MSSILKRTPPIFILLAIFLAFIGCVSSGDNSKIASEYEKFRNSLPPAKWRPTGVPSVDDIGILSAQVYRQTYQFLQEYISATENNRYYVGLMNEVDEIKKTEDLDDCAALQKAFYNIAEADKHRPEGEEPALPRVIEGYNAVQALKPSNKLPALAQMLPVIADIILRAKKLPDEVVAVVKNDPLRAVFLAGSVSNILTQLYHTQKMVQYIKMQYTRNQEMKNYMQD